MNVFESKGKRQLAQFAVVSVAIAALALVSSATVGATAASSDDQVLHRGEYLIEITGCNDCHTPLKMGPNGPEPDMSRMLSGHPAELPLDPVPVVDPEGLWNWTGSATLTAFVGPWGVSVARNLTPDQETGLGRWTEEQFVRAMRQGLHQGQVGGRPILPPMPWPGIARMTDEDLHALWAYLQSIPAIHNEAPQSRPAPPPGS